LSFWNVKNLALFPCFTYANLMQPDLYSASIKVKKIWEPVYSIRFIEFDVMNGMDID